MRTKVAVGFAYMALGLHDQLHQKTINALVLALASAIWFYWALLVHERVNQPRKSDPGH